MSPRPFIAAAFAFVAACSKPDPEVKTQTGDPAAAAPTMASMGGGGADYDGAKACCDALMAQSTDPEEGGVFRRAGATCVTRAADVLTGKATKADVLSAVAPIVPAEKLPDACK